MIKKLILVLLIGIIMVLPSPECLAQTTNLNPGLSNIILPSPSAASISKFGSIMVSQSSGIPKISVPIFEINTKRNKCNLEISLDYHAGGVRVDEIASNIGMGWALNGGGVITRAIRGIPDEIPLNGFLSQGSLPQDEYAANSPGSDTYERPANKILTNRLDGQIDLFSFNFNGRSGKFLYGKNGDFLVSPQQKLLIKKTLGTVSGKSIITRISITTEDGYNYEFGDYEITSGSSEYNLNGFATAWYLSKIVTPGKTDSIMFRYDTWSSGIYNVSRAFSETRPIIGTSPSSSYSGSFISQFGNFKRLTNIELADKTKINFLYDAQLRTDWQNDKALKSIIISNNDKILKKYELQQSYLSGRLFLDKVITKDSDNISNGEYKFEYLGGLPLRLDTRQDHWGFANSNTGTMIPEENYYGRLYSGGNRNTNPLSGISGSMQKITYPTGGYTIFEMEVNKARIGGYSNLTGFSGPETYIGGIRVKKITDYDGVNTVPAITREYNYTMPSGESSGTIANYPVYSSEVYYGFREGGSSSPNYQEYYVKNTPNVLVRSSSSIYNLSYALGSPVTYQRVEEKYVSPNGISNGKTIKIFTAFQDGSSSLTPYGFPQTPAYFSDWLYGLLKQELIYDNDGNLIKKTENSYNHIDDYFYQNSARIENFRSISIAPVKFITSNVSSPSLGGEPVYFLINSFVPVAGRSELTKTINTTYGKNGDSLSVATTKLYDLDDFHLQSSTTTNSNGTLTKTEYKYPKDMISQGRDLTGVYQEMYNNHIYSPIIERIVTSSSSPIEYQRTDYFKPYTGMYVPESIYAGRSISTSEAKVRYNAYDKTGNLLSVKKEGGTTTSYKWGYSNQYPTVEVKNASTTEFYQENFEEGLNFDANSQLDYSKVHTGKASGRIINTGSTEKNSHSTLLASVNLTKATKFTYSGWVYSDGPSTDIYLFMKRANENQYFSYVDYVSTSKTGEWVYLTKEFEVPADVKTLSLRVDNNSAGNVWFDDLRILPFEAAMSTYTYDPLIGVTSSIEDNGKTTIYNYDGFNRLSNIRNQNQEIVQNFRYNYGNTPAPVTMYKNDVRTGTFTRNNCSSGQVGSSVVYTVAQDKYTAESKAAANALADAEIAAQGQSYANANGTCTVPTGQLTIAIQNNYPQETNFMITFNGGSSGQRSVGANSTNTIITGLGTVNPSTLIMQVYQNGHLPTSATALGFWGTKIGVIDTTARTVTFTGMNLTQTQSFNINLY